MIRMVGTNFRRFFIRNDTRIKMTVFYATVLAVLFYALEQRGWKILEKLNIRTPINIARKCYLEPSLGSRPNYYAFGDIPNRKYQIDPTIFFHQTDCVDGGIASLRPR